MSNFVFPPKETVGLPIHRDSTLFPVRRVYCVGQNYADHAREMGSDPNRSEPFFFCKQADKQGIAFARGNDTLTLPFPTATELLSYELEIAIAIGQQGKNITPDQAEKMIFGYAICFDMTRRDLQKGFKERKQPWEMAKAFDQALPISAVYQKSDLPNIHETQIKCLKNGEVVQLGNSNMMIWSIEEIISKLSQYVELYPGDLILTGTPAGVGPVCKHDILEAVVDGFEPFKVNYI
ncbi:fumarylacetoacetate hydrolase family protein [Basilea psittacipulmonis]|uniref:Fumarylacetoacetase-like C-terminal domain-containing protein n=1 Tax=Basilea psittacipulmonis DSM 24701 TaxID=1072685 RepID=A0A077DFU1_9BURK|nr:fumarylacetoacetate hydrolase family protein [Basilea psittacipulmonis]AIL33046.1 hypothetical protein IX83_06755 [Basilea psittacipulmonis DSM 24701]